MCRASSATISFERGPTSIRFFVVSVIERLRSDENRAASSAAMWVAATGRKSAKLGHAFRSMTEIRPPGETIASPPYTSSPSAKRREGGGARQRVRVEGVVLELLVAVVEPLEPGRPIRLAVDAGHAVELDQVARHVVLHDGARDAAPGQAREVRREDRAVAGEARRRPLRSRGRRRA